MNSTLSAACAPSFTLPASAHLVTRAAFGKTWWGEQWLNALAHTDFDNRLPRGLAYANKGAVSQLSVAGGTFACGKSEGLAPATYRVAITVPPIAARDGDRLLDRIATDPALIAAMLNGQLDPAVLTLATELTIVVFPTRSHDLAMRCSCPDWPVPCKLLAAAIYLLSREIDGNSLLVFSLRGVDLAAALRARDIHIGDDVHTPLPTLAELLPTSDEDGAADAGLRDGLDFSLLPELAEPLLRVLPTRPPFFAAGNFRETLWCVLARVAKAARQALDTVATDQDGLPLPALLSPAYRACLVLDATHALTLTGVANIADWPTLVAALAELSPARLPDVQPQLAALQSVRLLALHLLARGAVGPQVFALKADEVALRSLPAILDAAVRELMRRIRDGLPPGRVALREGRKTLPRHAEAQATALCSLFLDHFIRQRGAADRKKPVGDKTLTLLFGCERVRYDGPGEGSIAAGIHTWLARFHLARREHAPVLCLDEGGADRPDAVIAMNELSQSSAARRGDHFELSLAAESRAALEPPVALATVLGDPGWAQARHCVLQTVSLLPKSFSAAQGLRQRRRTHAAAHRRRRTAEPAPTPCRCSASSAS